MSPIRTPHRAGQVRWLFVLVFAGCGGGRGDLFVEVRTDLVPGVEFTNVQVEHFDSSSASGEVASGADRVVHGAFLGDSFADGLAVASFLDLQEGDHVLRTRLLDVAASVVLERITIVRVRGRTVVSVLLTRDCRGVVCPGAGEPSAVSCFGGRCVDPHCVDRSSPSCPTDLCRDSTTCADVGAPCAAKECAQGVCLLFPDDGACGPEEYCHPEEGCRTRPALVDAGTDAGRDAGTDAGRDAGTDAGGDAGVDAGGDAGVDAAGDAAAAGCTAHLSCPTVGDVCSDGSLFAGFLIYGESSCEALYVTNENQSATSLWKIATGTDDIGTDDEMDGWVNHQNRLGALADFPVFDLCESSTYHGKSDWYVPARNELNLLWDNRRAIDANAVGAFISDGTDYWSSTEYDTSKAWVQDFGDGRQFGDLKTSTNDALRCVRRD